MKNVNYFKFILWNDFICMRNLKNEECQLYGKKLESLISVLLTTINLASTKELKKLISRFIRDHHDDIWIYKT